MQKIAEQNPDYDEEQVAATCGKIRSDLGEGSLINNESAAIKVADQISKEQQTVNYEQDGRLFMKVFLLDGSENGNHWGVKSDSIEGNITSAIGKPLVLYKNSLGQFDHPTLNDKSFEHAMAYQDLYRVGTFIDIHESPTHKGRWYGTAEITDENFKKAVKEDPSIPFYVSPTIRIMRDGQDDRQLTDWQFVHSALVDRPAYGIHTAYMGSSCTGDSQTCLLQLRKASIDANGGKVGCGFCTYKAAKQIQKTIVRSASLEVSSLDSSPSKQKTELLTNVINASEGEAKEETKTEVKKKTEPLTGETKVEEKTETKTEGEQQQKNASTNKELLEQIERLSTRNKELEIKLNSASSDKNALETIVAKLNEDVTTLKQAAEADAKAGRLREITEIVENATMFRGMPQEQRQKTIENFMTGAMSLEQIKEMLVPIEANIKKQTLSASAGPSYRHSSLQLGNNKTVTGAVETKSASLSAKGDNDDELPYYLQLKQQMFKGRTGTGGGVA